MLDSRTQRDISADLGNLDSGRPIPMYSYERPAYIIWQGVYDGLRYKGLSHAKAVEWLQSKAPRWALDGSLGDAIRQLGFDLGSRQP